MTRRGLLTASALIAATALTLGLTSMTLNPLAVLAIWGAAVVVALLLASALAAAWERHDRRVLYSAAWRDARRALR